MKYITIINAVSKTLTTILLFLFVKERQDYVWVTGLYGLANIIAGILSYRLAIKTANLVYTIPERSEIIKQLKENWNLFTSNFSVIIFSSINMILLRFWTTDTELGQYGLAEKIAFTVWQLLIVFSQAVYPNICRLAQDNHESLVHFFQRVFIPFLLFIFSICLLIFLWANQIVIIITGSEAKEAAQLLKIMSFFGFLTCLNIPAYQTFLAYNLHKRIAQLLNFMSIINILLAGGLIWLYGAKGAAIAAISTQALLTLLLHYVLQKKYHQYSILKIVKIG